MRIRRLVLAAGMFAASAMLPGCEESKSDGLPPAGTYRFVTLEPPPGQLGLIAWFRVEYRGPKPWLEIVLENRVDGEVVGTELLLRRPYGIDDLAADPSGSTTSVDSTPFTHPIQTCSLLLSDLPETLDGKTTFSMVNLSGSSASIQANGHPNPNMVRVEASVRVAEASGSMTSQTGTRFPWNGDYPDTDARMIWSRSMKVRAGDPKSETPTSRTHESVIFLRFVAD